MKPGDVSQWSSVLFVRKGSFNATALQIEAHCSISGPYAPAILRFEIVFPSNYPNSPPVIRFTSDVFHPLVAPLTTYTCSSSTQSRDELHVGAVEYLPPGGFSLVHGFPRWFEKPESSVTSSMPSSEQSSGLHQHQRHAHEIQGFERQSTASTSNASGEQSCSPHGREHAHTLKTCGSITARVGITAVLRYVKEAFDDVELLDKIALDSAANAGAWKAWRAHRKGILNSSTESRGSLAPRDGRDLRNIMDKGISLQRPSQSEDWNWDGVWQERVRNVIIASNSELALYGASGGDNPVGVQHRFSKTFANTTLKVRFVETDDELVQTVKTNALLSQVL